MPFENMPIHMKRIAVIGGGVSGLGAAYRLARKHNVVLFEAEPRLGGHARTVMAGKNGDQPVDTGFLVFNHVNYPHLTQMFAELNVPTVESNMSFGASIDGGRIEYALTSLNAIFAQRRNTANPKFIAMLGDILKFNKHAVKMAQNPDITIGQLIMDMGLGDWFRDYYLTPFTGAIWSTPIQGILEFPAKALITFMENHALLNATGQHQWYTVNGGSREYVTRLTAYLDKAGVELRLSAPIDAVTRTPKGVQIKAHGAEVEHFDEVIFATHSDVSHALLKDASLQEATALSAVRYQPNDMVLHADDQVMPKRKLAWASWAYTEEKGKKSDRIDLSYWINNLQPHLPKDDPCFVTLNTTRDLNPDLIYDQTTFMHPVFDLAALQAQRSITAFNGTNNTWFCGAWMRNGFHEDGLATATETADALMARAAMVFAAE